jgi:mRNA interferase RelE/StbE
VKELVYKPIVLKQLKKLPLVERKKIVKKLEFLQKDPLVGKQLKGELAGLWSLKAWPYRIIYQLEAQTITIFSISHRQTAYRK